MRTISMTLMYVAAFGVAVAVLSHAWLTNEQRDLHFGLLSLDAGGGDVWTNRQLAAAAPANPAQTIPSLFAPMGQVTFALGWVAVLLLCVAPVVWAMRRFVQIALAAAVASSVVYAWSAPTGPAFGVNIGWSICVFMAAAVAGGFGAQLHIKQSPALPISRGSFARGTGCGRPRR